MIDTDYGCLKKKLLKIFVSKKKDPREYKHNIIPVPKHRDRKTYGRVEVYSQNYLEVRYKLQFLFISALNL